MIWKHLLVKFDIVINMLEFSKFFGPSPRKHRLTVYSGLQVKNSPRELQSFLMFFRMVKASCPYDNGNTFSWSKFSQNHEKSRKIDVHKIDRGYFREYLGVIRDTLDWSPMLLDRYYRFSWNLNFWWFSPDVPGGECFAPLPSPGGVPQVHYYH